MVIMLYPESSTFYYRQVTLPMSYPESSTLLKPILTTTDICHEYGLQWDIRFNPQKSQASTFGGASPPMAIRIGDGALEWVNRVKYLGCFLGSTPER